MKIVKPTYRIVVNEYENTTEYFPMLSKDGVIWSRILVEIESVETMEVAKQMIKAHEKEYPKITVLEKRGDKYIQLTEKDI